MASRFGRNVRSEVSGDSPTVNMASATLNHTAGGIVLLDGAMTARFFFIYSGETMRARKKRLDATLIATSCPSSM